MAPLGVSAERYRLYGHPAHMVWRASAHLRWGVWMWLLMWLVGHLVGGVDVAVACWAPRFSWGHSNSWHLQNLSRRHFLARSASTRESAQIHTHNTHRLVELRLVPVCDRGKSRRRGNHGA